MEMRRNFQLNHQQWYQMRKPRKKLEKALRKKSLKRKKFRMKMTIVLLWFHMTKFLECKSGVKTIASLEIVLKPIVNANDHKILDDYVQRKNKPF